MKKIRSHEWDVGIQGCRINEGRLYQQQCLYLGNLRTQLFIKFYYKINDFII